MRGAVAGLAARVTRCEKPEFEPANRASVITRRPYLAGPYIPDVRIRAGAANVGSGVTRKAQNDPQGTVEVAGNGRSETSTRSIETTASLLSDQGKINGQHARLIC